MLQLHRFMIAVARVTVNHDGRGGTAPDPLVWDQGGQRETRRIDIRVHVDLASLPGPPGFLDGPWLQVHGVGLLALKLLPGHTVLASFASLLLFLEPCIGHWVLRTWVILWFLIWNFLSFFEQWAGHRLLSEKVTKPYLRANRPISFPSVFVSEGIEIRHGCQFISSLVRALAKLPGGLCKFLPCGIGSHMSRLRHLGWNQCSHGLTSRP